MPLLVPEVPIEALARTFPLPRLDFSDEQCDRIAALAYQIARVEGERAHLPDLNFVPYAERTAAQRLANRMAVVRVLQATVLLGGAKLVEQTEAPGLIVGP